MAESWRGCLVVGESSLSFPPSKIELDANIALLKVVSHSMS